jgi:hypothetical protein
MSGGANSMILYEVLCRYLRDLRLRTFPDNDEGDHGLRFAAAEIKRVELLIGEESSAAAKNSELLEALEKAREDINWMLNSGNSLNGFVFDYIDAAIAKARGE